MEEGLLNLLIADVGLLGLNGQQLAEIAMTGRYPVKVLFVIGYAEAAASRADFLASVKRSVRGGSMDTSIPHA